MALIAPPPPAGGMQYSAVRFGYANNGQAVVFAHGETWTGSTGCPSDYEIPWAREFRYDGARARYMNRKLNSDLSPATGGTVWSDYDGDEIYGDFTVASASPWMATTTDQYEPGMWRKVGGVSDYLHNDMLGTLRQTTGTTGAASGSDVFTAFGERISGTNDRFGYVGAFGYQAATSATPGDPYVTGFPFLHVGARYYDPSSGRFLQRDPIGIRGGRNVFTYVGNEVTRRIDPLGLIPMDDPRYPPIPRPEPPSVPEIILIVTPEWLDDPNTVDDVQWWLQAPAIIITAPLAWWAKVPMALQWALWCSGAGAWLAG